MNFFILNKKSILLAVLILVFVSLRLFSADIYLKLSGHGQRTDIGIAGFVPKTPTVEESKYARDLKMIVVNDLLFARYFNIIESGPAYTGKQGEMEQWKDNGANILVAGDIKITEKNINLTIKLYDVFSNASIWEKSFIKHIKSYRMLAHQVNNEIIKYLVGEEGIAETKIAFVSNKSGSKEIYLIDYDGYNLRRLTKTKSINVLPAWSPSGDEILFTTYIRSNPDLYSISLKERKIKKISTIQGLNTAASFSPDGETIALTISKGSYPNIYLISKNGQLIKQLTRRTSIETSPSFSPNGKEIVYISDRPGYPQLYIMNIDGGNVRRLYTKGFCDSPVWSPRGDKIVFSMRQNREKFDLYLYDLPTGRIKRLTQNEGNNENPSWSPDGRFIVFSSTRTRQKCLYIMGIDGLGVRKLASIEGSSITPAWSPK
ncbi:Tol-Pal system beta propeller repeat protein TolB [Elusimicrobiota bacterium]